jgi:SAM-dependent methyltransferase
MNQLEHIDECPVCDSRPGRLFASKEGLTYVRCQECDLVYANTRPSEAAMASRLEMWGEKYSASDEYLRDRVRSQRVRVRLLRTYCRSGSLLDFGSGDGSFLRAAMDAGYRAEGVEKAVAAAKFARSHFGASIRASAIEDASLESRMFDVITMWDVLEHLLDPVHVVKGLGSRLAKDGCLVVLTPHSRGFSSRVRGPAWWVFGPHDHVCLFSTRTVEYLLQRSGLRLRFLATRDLVPWSPPGEEGGVVSLLWKGLSVVPGFLRVLTALSLGDWILLVAQRSAIGEVRSCNSGGDAAEEAPGPV